MMSVPTPNSDNIVAVIVTYYPDVNFIDRVAAILPQVAQIIIVDNTSSGRLADIQQRLSSFDRIHWILNPQNFGVAKALNQGIGWAKKKGYPWVLTFDQDSLPCRDMVDRLKQVYEQLNDPEKIAVIGSNYVEPNSGRVYYASRMHPKKLWVEQKTVVTSGSLMPIGLFDKIGTFREDFFIDNVDIEYCLRARRSGYKNILVVEPLLKHAIGNPKAHHMFSLSWFKTYTSHYAPFRWYFIIRNRLILVGEYLLIDPFWAAHHLIHFIGFIVKGILFEEDKREKLRCVWLGVIDAITGNRHIWPPK